MQAVFAASFLKSAAHWMFCKMALEDTLVDRMQQVELFGLVVVVGGDYYMSTYNLMLEFSYLFFNGPPPLYGMLKHYGQ